MLERVGPVDLSLKSISIWLTGRGDRMLCRASPAGAPAVAARIAEPPAADFERPVSCAIA